MTGYFRPTDLSEALAALQASPRQVLAGGTDFYPARVGRPLDDDVLDITALPGLKSVTERDDHWWIGALTTWTDLVEATLPPYFDGLKRAARDVGGVQIQNAGTIAGNVCNASPAADGIPPLLALDARVQLESHAGRRSLALGDFVLGNRQIAKQPEELVTGLIVPRLPSEARSAFRKLGARRYLVISIVMVAAVIVPDDDGAIAEARIAVGACSPVAQRLAGLEARLAGRAWDAEIAGAVDPSDLDVLSPIDDVRGTATYRRDATLHLIRRALLDTVSTGARTA